MLLLSPQGIITRFGPSYPMGGARRFNTDAASLHRTPTHAVEFCYLKGWSIYDLVQKRVGSISIAERDALLASYAKAKGKWAVLVAGASSAAKKPNANAPTTLTFTPAEREVNFPRPVFASHQR